MRSCEKRAHCGYKESCIFLRRLLCGTKQRVAKLAGIVVSRGARSLDPRELNYLVWTGLEVNCVAPVAAWQWPACQGSTTETAVSLTPFW